MVKKILITNLLLLAIFITFVDQSWSKDLDNKYKKEWVGESGYCNCLLTTMCRIPIKMVTLQSDQQVPNLEVLAAPREETASWIKAQELPYEKLSSKDVIKILIESAGISTSFWSKKKAQLETYIVDNHGGTIKKIFSFELQKEKKDVLKLIVTLNNP